VLPSSRLRMARARMGVLEEEVRLAEALYRERHGDFHYVTLENTAIFELQLMAVRRIRTQFHEMEIEQFVTIEEFKEFVLASLQDLYESRVILRSGVRMLIECVRDL